MPNIKEMFDPGLLLSDVFLVLLVPISDQNAHFMTSCFNKVEQASETLVLASGTIADFIALGKKCQKLKNLFDNIKVIINYTFSQISPASQHH